MRCFSFSGTTQRSRRNRNDVTASEVCVKNNPVLNFRLMRASILWALVGLSLPGAALAQASNDAARGDTVSWTVSAPADAVRPGGRLTLTLHGTVLDGWHVYALKQAPLGPTPLRVALDTNDVATADGATAGSPPIKIHDPAFDLETQFYAKPFTVTVPVRLGKHLAAGQQQIPVSVQFQTCNGRVCQPPKTVHLSAAINLPTGG